MPQVNPRSGYRCGKGLRSARRQEQDGLDAHPPRGCWRRGLGERRQESHTLHVTTCELVFIGVEVVSMGLGFGPAENVWTRLVRTPAPCHVGFGTSQVSSMFLCAEIKTVLRQSTW